MPPTRPSLPPRTPEHTQAPYYVGDHDRFKRTDAVAGELMEDRAREKARYEAKLDRKRAADYEREATRWGAFEQQQERAQVRDQALKESAAAWTNAPGLPFNVLNHAYAQGTRGEGLREYDQGVRERAGQRADRLGQKMHSTDFDIITGAPRAPK